MFRTPVLFRKHSRLNRNSAHRRSLLRNQVTSLFQYERIETTVAKARETQRSAEKIITYAKRQFLKGGTPEQKQHAKNLVSAFVLTPEQQIKAIEVLAWRYRYRNGGYTRVMKLSKNRKGDGAPMAVVELVDRPGEIRAARPSLNPSFESLFDDNDAMQVEPTEDKDETKAVRME